MAGSTGMSEVSSAALAIIRAAERVRNRATAMLEPHDLTPQQYNVLRVLRGAYPEPLPTLEVGSHLVEQCPGVTRLLDRLVEKGLVRRERGEDDRRQVYCSLTPAGLEAWETAREVIQAAHRRVLGHFTSAEVLALVALLERVDPPE